MSKKFSKTNAMRILDQEKIPYEVFTYPDDGPVSAVEVASYLHEAPERVFKTLVTTDGEGLHHVFCLPGNQELDLKKAAKAVHVKRIEMLKQKDLFPLTGYVHGGCSPLGMKKSFPTVMHSSALTEETIFVSGGKIGLQIQIAPKYLEKLLLLTFEDLIL